MRTCVKITETYHDGVLGSRRVGLAGVDNRVWWGREPRSVGASSRENKYIAPSHLTFHSLDNYPQHGTSGDYLF